MANSIHRNALKAGSELHWYRIGRVLGQGSFGITYLAHDLNLDRRVVIKEYLPIEIAVREAGDAIYPVSDEHLEQYRWGLDRFIAEARLLAKFNHPNIVQVLNAFEANNTAYIVMVKEEGESLEDVLNHRERLEEAELTAILFPVLDGLEKVHESGFIHRDIKPANIWIRPDGSPVLLDFGSARQAMTKRTRTLTTAFSPGFAPIEQYHGDRELQGSWTDIYGLGATLYRAVARVAPMDALRRSQAILEGAGDPLISAMQAGLGRYSDAFLKAIDHALNFMPTQRPRTVAAWRKEFSPERPLEVTPVTESSDRPYIEERATDSGMPVVATTAISRPASRWRWAQRIIVVTGLFGLAVFLGLRPGPFQELLDTAPRVISTLPLADSMRADVDPSNGASSAPESAVEPPPKEDSTLSVASSEDADVVAQSANLAASPIKEQISSLLASADEDIKAGRLTSPAGESAADKYRAVLVLQPDHEQASQALHDIMDQFIGSAREALEAKEWAKAEAHIEQLAAILPNSEEAKALQQALRTGKAQAEKKRKAQQAKQEEAKRTVDKLLELALKAMEQQDLQTAQLYVDQAAAIRPDSSDLALLRDELLSRKAQASRQTIETPRSAQPPTKGPANTEKGPTEVARLAIRQAVSSLTKVRPGETVEFYTEYSVTPPAGKKDAFVEATWVLMRNGRMLGEEGYQYKFTKPGVHTASTELTLPPWVAPGRYTVEHRVQAGNSFGVARTHFFVVSN